VKTTVGITHEDELVKALEVLADKVHPLALGNVERFLSQSRMTARKIMRTHMGEGDRHIIDEIVENMASKLYFHGHPINRKEAREDLRLKVAETVTPELEVAMWDLYKDYEEEFQNQELFNPASDLYVLKAAAFGQTPPHFKPLIDAQGQPIRDPQSGQQAFIQAAVPEKEYDLLHVMIESKRLSSRFTSKRRFRLHSSQPGQVMIEDEILAQGWNHLLDASAE
jgi:hypothetical protein